MHFFSHSTNFLSTLFQKHALKMPSVPVALHPSQYQMQVHGHSTHPYLEVDVTFLRYTLEIPKKNTKCKD